MIARHWITADFEFLEWVVPRYGNWRVTFTTPPPKCIVQSHVYAQGHLPAQTPSRHAA